MPMTRLPRLTRDSLEGTPDGACWSAQKDASVSWSRYMIALLVLMNRRMVASTAQLARTNIRGTHARSLARYLRQMRTSTRMCRCINVQPGWLVVVQGGEWRSMTRLTS